MRSVSQRNLSSSTQNTNTPPKAEIEPQAGSGRPTEASRTRPEIPALTIEGVKRTLDKPANARKRGNERRMQKRSALPAIHLIASKKLPRAISRAQQSLPPEGILVSNALIAHAESLIDPAGHVMRDRSGDAALSPGVRHIMECLEAKVANHQEEGPDAGQERRCMMIDRVGALFRNDSRSDAVRIFASWLNPTLRTGVIILLAKLVQDALKFELSKAAELGGQESSQRIAGILALVIAPALNVVGAILSGGLGTANLTSLISRLWLGLLYLSLLGACYQTGVLHELGFSLMPSVTYALVRDGLSYCFPIRDNVGSVSGIGLGIAAFLYSLLNALSGFAGSKAAPTAGAGALPRAGNATERMMPEHRAAVANAVLDLDACMVNAAICAVVEISDDLILPLILRWIETRKYRKKEALNMDVEAAHSEYIGELIALAKELLKTPRNERQQKIDALNLDLYRREHKRLTRLKDEHPLDDAHQQYLDSLHKELLVYQQTKVVREMWEALRNDPNCYRAHQLSQLKSAEVALGIYRKTRELDRLKRLDADWIDTEQRRDLADLQDQVDRDLEKWNELAPADQRMLNDDEKELLRQLASEFASASDIDLKPVRLRPIPSLQPDAQKAPDFTRFAQKIRNTCRSHTDLTPKERTEIVEELYMHEFVRHHLPGKLTNVEQKVVASIGEENPKILPSELFEQLQKDVAEERRKATEGIRLGLGFLPANVSSLMEAVRHGARQLLVTNAARQSALGSVYAFLLLLAALMGDSIKHTDDNTQLTVGNLAAGFGIFMVYWALIMMHSEGAPGGGVYRPGAESTTLPPLPGRQAPEDLYTPRTVRYEPDDRGISETDSDSVAESGSESDPESVSESDEVIELRALSIRRAWAE